MPLSRYWIYKLLEREEFPFLCPFKYMSVCCSTESVHLLTFCWCLFLFCVCVSCVSLSQTLGFFFRYLGKNIDYWLVHFWILTDSYLIFSHFILTHLPASQVAGAIDPLWLSQRNHWSCAMQPLPLRFAYRIHKQTYKDAIEVKESSQSELAHWHARTHKHMWAFRLVTSEILQMRF